MSMVATWAAARPAEVQEEEEVVASIVMVIEYRTEPGSSERTNVAEEMMFPADAR